MIRWFKKRFFVLIVCTANRTRSAYLAGYLRHLIRQIRPGALRRLRIASAGTRAVRGGRVNDSAAMIARRNGFSIRSHLSSPVTARTVRRADLILVMEKEQKEWILERWPNASRNVFLLMEYGWQGDEEEAMDDVPDPTGADAEAFLQFEALAHAEAARVVDELMRRGVVR